MFPDPPEPPQSTRQWFQAEMRRVAVIIRQLEQETPGCFGEAAAVIRQQAAGDDVAPDDLMVALASEFENELVFGDVHSVECRSAVETWCSFVSDGHAARRLCGILA